MKTKKTMMFSVILVALICIFTMRGIDKYCYVFAANVIYYGSDPKDIQQVQQKLEEWGYMSDGQVDGQFGWKTEQAVKKFQRNHGLVADGKAGQQTLNAMGLGHLLEKQFIKSNYQASRGATNRDEAYLLAQAIHGEARGEPYIGKVAVGAVILNRVQHPSFPNTINGVIFQPGAFSAVSDGQIYLSPDENSIKAANDALTGWDPSGGAIYYYNPAKTTNQWVYSRPVIKTIGKHIFAK
ncbi:spore cortex-lytic enzyme [Garciella nitratireducens]|uniref:Spore cortex-lytic enzyme n=1 Tax=Garciella nitratireducens DSM 15102 TaxID=1121911 RepID=A0A1T4MGB5_9FIRM|nr:spore cortex-lytic enzyme [Garciella nitratireducens]SJZ65982.1 N-acetylmuramoyl-L-alanine amidase [Garciella nitratireducens DSM 15102]